jgi:hypothetical protein
MVEKGLLTRMVSLARNRLDPRKSCATFKGIFCHDISEFESYMPSHAVGSLWRVDPVHGRCWFPRLGDAGRFAVPWRRPVPATGYVDKILRGGKPGEMNRPLRFGKNRNLHVSRAFYIHLPKNGE